MHAGTVCVAAAMPTGSAVVCSEAMPREAALGSLEVELLRSNREPLRSLRSLGSLIPARLVRASRS